MKNRVKKKRSSKNLKINTRIVLTSVLGIIIPIVIIALFSTAFISTISSYFNFSSVTTNSYSAVNQIQWSQTLSSITYELISDNADEEKLDNLSKFVSPLEELHSLIYVERDSTAFYTSDEDINILELADKLTDIDNNENINYFSSKGLVIVSHAQKDESSPQYRIVIVNEDYIVNDAYQRLSAEKLSNLLLGRTGLIVLIIVLLFVAAISIMSFITTQTIVKPINKIAQGADEIAKGNLDYEIDYKSTNELGQTVESFNDMRLRLKESIEKQRKSEEERKVLVAGIAHDLRTPLTSARGYAEGLRDGIADTPQKRESYIQIICNSIDDTQRILDDLLTVSKLELNGLKLNKIDVNVREFFDDGAQEIKTILDNNGFDFYYENRCDDNLLICIDADRFARVINNIISNSVKYAKEDVKGKVRMIIDEYDKSVIIELADNGIGVDSMSLPKIFDTMYRADPARTKVSQGSGLGLSVCKQIVELHNGSIWARSKNGEGLSVFISLPKKYSDKEI